MMEAERVLEEGCNLANEIDSCVGVGFGAGEETWGLILLKLEKQLVGARGRSQQHLSWTRREYLRWKDVMFDEVEVEDKLA